MNKKYSEEQERMARFAKAMGHPARMAILQFLLAQESCYFGDIHEELPIACWHRSPVILAISMKSCL